MGLEGHRDQVGVIAHHPELPGNGSARVAAVDRQRRQHLSRLVHDRRRQAAGQLVPADDLPVIPPAEDRSPESAEITSAARCTAVPHEPNPSPTGWLSAARLYASGRLGAAPSRRWPSMSSNTDAIEPGMARSTESTSRSSRSPSAIPAMVCRNSGGGDRGSSLADRFGAVLRPRPAFGRKLLRVAGQGHSVISHQALKGNPKIRKRHGADDRARGSSRAAPDCQSWTGP